MFKKIFCKGLIVFSIVITLVSMFSISALAVEENTVMTVYTKYLDEEIYEEFDNFEDGWVFITEKAPTYFGDFDVKLYADWIAPNGSFYYTNDEGKEVGTDKGRLYVGLSWYEEGGKYNYNDINIDLNGHKIDRNLKQPTENGSVFYIENGSVKIFDSSEAQMGMITGANNTGNGGAFYVDNGLLNINKSAIVLEGGTITGNYAANGAGIYWNSDGLLILSDGAITGNHATEKGGGICFNDWGDIYIGGTPVIKDNYIKGTGKQSNLYLADSDAVIKLTRDQEVGFNLQYVPDNPLSEGAEIGFSTIGDDKKLTDENSLFREEDFTYFFPDDTTHFVRSVHSENEGVTSYDLYYTSWNHTNKRAPRVTNVSVKDNTLVKGVDFNYDKQILTLTVASNKRDYFDLMSLDRLVSFEFNDEKYYIARSENPRNLHEGQQYRIMADNGTYVLLIVNIVPEGGKWAETQDPYVPEYVAIVFNEHYAAGYTDIGKAWADAVKQSITNPTTIKLFSDWVATDGEFYAEDTDGEEYGTSDGYLYIDNEEAELTIDLNGHTIDRNLDKPISNGYIMYIGEGLITIADTSEEGNGKITGGNNTGDGGAFFIDNGLFGLPTKGGTLIVKGGSITGNHSDDRGGAIYSESQGHVVMYEGKITNNTAEHGGAIAVRSGCYAFFYNGEVSGNSATEYGGAFYCYDGGKVILDGSTVVSNNTAPYGGCAYIDERGTVYFYSGYVKNNTADYGGGIYTYDSFVLAGSEAYLIDNVAKYDGGGVYALGEYGEIRINFGNIKGNKATNGAGVYWDGGSNYDYFLLSNAIITENEASGIGGGVYVADDRNIYVGGKTVISDNTSSLGTDNVNLLGYDSTITHGVIKTYGTSLEEGSEIGVRTERIKSERIIVSKDGGFVEDSINYFTADDAATALSSVEDSDYNGYRISLVDKYDGEMLVEVEGGDTKSFENFGKGWVYALQQSLSKPTTITLGADWIANNGMFYCIDEDGDEYGTNNGYLYINDDHIITIDLNGHKIDRNLKTATEDGVVFWLYDYDSRLTIKDSFGGGKITGGNNTDNGGAFFVERGSLYIEGAEISGNKAANGAGIYWESRNNLCVYDGKITGNTATENGGGVYGTDYGNMYFGGNAFVSGNTDKNSKANNLYLDDNDVFVNLTAGQSEGIPNIPFTEGASIGVSAYNSQALISGANSCFGWDDFNYFFSDSDEYYIRVDYDAAGGNNEYKLYIDSIANMPEPAPDVMSVAVEGGVTQSFNDFGKGWGYALKQSASKPTTITLLADWTAENGYFVYDYGTKDGYLHLNNSDINMTLDLNGYTIDRGLTTPTENGCVFYLEEGNLTITDSIGTGKITGAYNTENGGAFLVKDANLSIKGGTIIGNKAVSGAAIYCGEFADAYIRILDGKITGNNATDFGGGIAMFNGYIHMDGGEISGNSASAGAGIFITSNFTWSSGGAIYLTGGKITGNFGGSCGVWCKTGIYLGGDIQIVGNENLNLYLPRVLPLHNACGQDGAPNEPLTEGADIGIFAVGSSLSNETSMFGPDTHNYIHSDDPAYAVETVYDSNNENHTYQLYLRKTQKAMEVTIEGETTAFYEFNDAWTTAVEAAEDGTPVKVTLLTDWLPNYNQGFSYSSGTENGYMYLDNPNINLTVDLNGYSINRGLSDAKKNGMIFKIDEGTLTIIDSVGTGKITGAYNNGNGGAFLVEYGSLYIKGGEISGNKAENGGAIYCNDLDDAYIYIEGGKLVNNTATKNGGAIYMYDGYLDITGGEISGNTAVNGAGIYWESDNAAYLTGGNIINNNASGRGGVYVEANGKVYLGGNVHISGNKIGNLYLSEDDANIYNAAGQDGVPNKPLTSDAEIYISAAVVEDEISGDNSKFNEGDFGVMYSDSSSYFIRSVYDINGGNHSHKLFINSWSHSDSRYPRVKTVSLKNNDVLEDVTFNYDKQIITLKAYVNNKDSLKSVALDSLISYTCDKDIYSIYGADKACDLTTAKEFKIISDNGTYVMCRVEVEWLSEEVEIRGYSLLLEGSIGVKLYASLSEYAIADLNKINATVEYMGETIDVSIVNAEDPDDKSLYYVQFNVAPKEMHEKITFNINAIRSSKTLTVSVKDYVDYVNDNREEYADSIGLINTMFNYGEYARQYFCGAEITPNPDLSQSKLTLSSRYIPSKEGSVSGLNVYATSLLLESNTTIRHYFELADGASIDNYSFTLDNAEELTPVQKGDLYYVDITDIVAHRLNEMVTLEVSYGDESLRVVYSPLSYAKLVTDNATNQGDNLVTLIKALYNYYIMSSEYAEHINSFDGVLDENESKPEIW